MSFDILFFCQYWDYYYYYYYYYYDVRLTRGLYAEKRFYLHGQNQHEKFNARCTKAGSLECETVRSSHVSMQFQRRPRISSEVKLAYYMMYFHLLSAIVGSFPKSGT
jgi:rRNA maturation protein Rpf1